MESESEAVSVKCPFCGAEGDVPKDFVGQVIECPKCGKEFIGEKASENKDERKKESKDNPENGTTPECVKENPIGKMGILQDRAKLYTPKLLVPFCFILVIIVESIVLLFQLKNMNKLNERFDVLEKNVSTILQKAETIEKIDDIDDKIANLDGKLTKTIDVLAGVFRQMDVILKSIQASMKESKKLAVSISQANQGKQDQQIRTRGRSSSQRIIYTPPPVIQPSSFRPTAVRGIDYNSTEAQILQSRSFN